MGGGYLCSMNSKQDSAENGISLKDKEGFKENA